MKDIFIFLFGFTSAIFVIMTLTIKGMIEGGGEIE
jgi:hypothetical protein